MLKYSELPAVVQSRDHGRCSPPPSRIGPPPWIRNGKFCGSHFQQFLGLLQPFLDRSSLSGLRFNSFLPNSTHLRNSCPSFEIDRLRARTTLSVSLLLRSTSAFRPVLANISSQSPHLFSHRSISSLSFPVLQATWVSKLADPKTSPAIQPRSRVVEEGNLWE